LWILPVLVVLAAGVVVRRGLAPETADAPETPAPQSATAPSQEGAQPPPVDPALWGSPILPIPATAHELDPRKVILGRRLFHDPRLSKDGTISCSSCHDLHSGGDDGRRVSIGVGGAPGAVNAPTVLNSAYNFRQFWDGRARSLEEQIDGPIQHPAEMAMDWPAVAALVDSDPQYAASFRELYGAPPSHESIENALATFERSLMTPGSDFDRYLLGDKEALSQEALAGYELYLTLGCATCHQGVNVGGNMFQPMGKMGDYFVERGTEITPADQGRFNVTGDERDRHTFKVPTLRNVELTAPYFHDGSVNTLEEAVQVMARMQLGEELSAEETAQLAAFLRSLTGKLLDPADR
jgi:cytochrome c peroxidase